MHALHAFQFDSALDNQNNTQESISPIWFDEGSREHSAPFTLSGFALNDASRRDRTQYYDLTTPSPRSTSSDISSTLGAPSTQAHSSTATPTSSIATTPSPQVHYNSLTSLACSISSHGAAPISNAVSDNHKRARARVRRVKDQDHIPRPRNAFIIFRSHYYNLLKAEVSGDGSSAGVGEAGTYPVMDDQGLFTQPTKKSPLPFAAPEYQQNELSKLAGMVWNKMNAEERRPYTERARKEKELHKRSYPDYVYRAPSAGKDKMKKFKIKVKTGNPSKAEKQLGRKKDSAASLPPRTNGCASRDLCGFSPESSLVVPSEVDTEFADVTRQHGNIESEISFVGSGSNQDLTTTWPFIENPTATPFQVNDAIGAFPPSSSGDTHPGFIDPSGSLSSSLTIPAIAQDPDFFVIFSSVNPYESAFDQYMPLDWGMDVPEYFLGDADMQIKENLSCWAGYE